MKLGGNNARSRENVSSASKFDYRLSGAWRVRLTTRASIARARALFHRADHYNGKQYLGWKAIREKLKTLEAKVYDQTRLSASRYARPRRYQNSIIMLSCVCHM